MDVMTCTIVFKGFEKHLVFHRNLCIWFKPKPF